jgi:hypothetical protein
MFTPVSRAFGFTAARNIGSEGRLFIIVQKSTVPWWGG